jgi:hypothetical protein
MRLYIGLVKEIEKQSGFLSFATVNPADGGFCMWNYVPGEHARFTILNQLRTGYMRCTLLSWFLFLQCQARPDPSIDDPLMWLVMSAENAYRVPCLMAGFIILRPLWEGSDTDIMCQSSSRANIGIKSLEITYAFHLATDFAIMRRDYIK